MQHDRIEWLRAGSEASSERQIYRLASEVADSASASVRHRRAARYVVKPLHGVIDQPIAEAKVLATARRRFAGLLTALKSG